jgi:hypothetical protein
VRLTTDMRPHAVVLSCPLVVPHTQRRNGAVVVIPQIAKKIAGRVA